MRTQEMIPESTILLNKCVLMLNSFFVKDISKKSPNSVELIAEIISINLTFFPNCSIVMGKLSSH